MRRKTDPLSFLEGLGEKPEVLRKPELAEEMLKDPAPAWRVGVKKYDLYPMWASMRSRCNSPTDKAYKYYGARGIKICRRWDNFYVFASDMGPRPSIHHEIDRINNNGDYCLENCRWVTKQVQNLNTRHNRNIEYHGIIMPMRGWEMVMGLPRGCIGFRLKTGWELSRAIETPKIPIGKYRRNTK